jgi:putative transcription factor
MESDWDTVTVLRKKAPKAAQMKTESAINVARRTGEAIETTQKCAYLFIQFKIKVI